MTMHYVLLFKILFFFISMSWEVFHRLHIIQTNLNRPTKPREWHRCRPNKQQYIVVKERRWWAWEDEFDDGHSEELRAFPAIRQSDLLCINILHFIHVRTRGCFAWKQKKKKSKTVQSVSVVSVVRIKAIWDIFWQNWMLNLIIIYYCNSFTLLFFFLTLLNIFSFLSI